MKLSEFTTEQAADILCTLSDPVANIVGDKALMDEMNSKFDMEGKTVAELYLFSAKKIATIVPILLKSHRDDLFEILATLNETDSEHIAKQNIIVTMKQIRDAVKDKELMDFFKSCKQEEETA